MEEYNGSPPSLVLNSHPWTKVSSIIFVDLPANTGFSYTKCPEIPERSDSKQIQHALQFFRKWLIQHPEFLSNRFYVGGDSYSGIIVPPLAFEILKGNEDNVQPSINFQGYILGNPETDLVNVDQNARVPFAHGIGLIYDELYEGSIGKWQVCKKSAYTFEIKSSFQFHVKLGSKGYCSLIYSGDHDMIIPFCGTEAWIRSLNYSVVDEWKQWLVQGQVSGYTRKYSNGMTFATIKGAGHTAPVFKPKE